MVKKAIEKETKKATTTSKANKAKEDRAAKAKKVKEDRVAKINKVLDNKAVKNLSIAAEKI